MNGLATDGRIPVTLLTGWLGAGKTTLLNRILSQPEGRKFAVLVNEFGEIGIDDRLVVRSDEEIVELRNGCICCSVRGDLVASLVKLHQSRARRWFGRRRFDHVLLETTGIAEPAPLLKTFLVEAQIAALFQMVSVLCLIDARTAAQVLSESTAEEQVAVADLLLLNKIDLVESEDLELLSARLRKINPSAELKPTLHADLSTAEVLAHRPPRIPAADQLSNHHHHEGFQAVSLTEDRPLDAMQTRLWLGACVRVLGARLIRYKGFLHLQGQPNRVVLQGVYDLFEANAGEPWGTDHPKTELVFIGRNLDRDFLRRGLDACVVA
ncbi:MAG: GTP-binding protein [Planctomycetota bacterium]|nr:MAG: GTP-binding protein [Planctomycetota bacterium]